MINWLIYLENSERQQNFEVKSDYPYLSQENSFSFCLYCYGGVG